MRASAGPPCPCRLLAGLLFLLGVCASNPDSPSPDLAVDLGPRDLRPSFPEEDLARSPDLQPCAEANLCGDCLEGCHEFQYGPPFGPFHLTGDPGPKPDPPAESDGLNRDDNGWLRLDSYHTVFNYVWVPNTHAHNDAGTVSKLDAKTVREVARYLSVTCGSLKSGSRAACDGKNGCCSMDDEDRFRPRLANKVELKVTTMAANASPKVKSLAVAYRCPQ